MSLVQTNATITRVQATRTGEDYEGPQTAGTQKWAAATGQAPNAYVLVKRRRVPLEGGAKTASERVLIIKTDDPPVDWAVGDIVTFVTAAGTTVQNARVDEVRAADIADGEIDRDLVTTTLVLTPA